MWACGFFKKRRQKNAAGEILIQEGKEGRGSGDRG